MVNPKTNPITEKFDTKGKTIYGISKLMGEEYCKSYNQKYKLDYTILKDILIRMELINKKNL